MKLEFETKRHTLLQYIKCLLDKQLRLWIKAILTILSVIVLLILLAREYDKLHTLVNWRVYFKACAYGFAIYPISLALQALIWNTIIARLGHVTDKWYNIETYAYTYLMRHLPSAAWYLAGRIITYHEQGVRMGVTLSASGLEWILLITTALLVYIIYEIYQYNAWLLLAFLALFLFPNIVRRISRAMKWQELSSATYQRLKTFFEIFSGVAHKELIFWGGLYTICYIIGGAILLLLTKAVVPTTNLTIIDTTGIWALTAGINFLVSTIIPLGLGVRELTLAVLFPSDISLSEGLAIALLMRLLFLVSDLVWGGTIWAIARYTRYHLYCKDTPPLLQKGDCPRTDNSS